MKFGIIGLPQSGKTTIFNALTGAHKDTASHFPVGDKPNIGVVKVPDERMTFLNDMFRPKKLTLAQIEYVDIAGIFTESGRGGKGPNPITILKEMDGIIQVVRAFKDEGVPHVHNSIDPRRDVMNMNADLLIADLDIIEKRIEKLKMSVKKPTKTQERDKLELDLLCRCKDALDKGNGLNTIKLNTIEEKLIRGFMLLTQKPRVILLNIGEDQLNDQTHGEGLGQDGVEILRICARLEMELTALDEADRPRFQEDLGIKELARDRIIRASARALNICHFFTVGSDEVKAWDIHIGDNAITAAGKIHTDIAQGFIRAETVSLEDLKESGSMKEVKARGKVRLEGKDYIVQDGDIINFRFNV